MTKKVLATFLPWIVAAWLLGILVAPKLMLGSPERNPVEQAPVQQTQQQGSTQQAPVDPVLFALSKSSANFKDYNGDRLVNCIDQALCFKEYLPEAKIYLVETFARNESHLYVMVAGERIEPSKSYKSSEIVNPVRGSKWNWDSAREISVKNIYSENWDAR